MSKTNTQRIADLEARVGKLEDDAEASKFPPPQKPPQKLPRYFPTDEDNFIFSNLTMREWADLPPERKSDYNRWLGTKTGGTVLDLPALEGATVLHAETMKAVNDYGRVVTVKTVPDEPPVGTQVRFLVTFPREGTISRSQPYTYLAIRVADEYGYGNGERWLTTTRTSTPASKEMVPKLASWPFIVGRAALGRGVTILE